MRLVLLGTLLALSCLATALYSSQLYDGLSDKLIRKKHKHKNHRPHNAREIVARCQHLYLNAEPSLDSFRRRSTSDRFEPGTRPVLIKNGRLWTGQKNGTQVIYGDILLDKGVIKQVGNLAAESLEATMGEDLLVADVKGAWVTPGIVDMHSHMAVVPLPVLGGAIDVDSSKSTISPWLRSLDGLNTHDESYMMAISGGVTTALILPGSEDAIGGQAFVIKLRQTTERSPSSMLLEPPYQINTSFPNPNLPPRWRHMKHACGETPGHKFNNTRMDNVWALREAYNTAKALKKRQDEYCSQVLSKNTDWKHLGEFPDAFQWESLVDVLRGRVKVNVHCYEAVDIDAIVRLSNEFEFPIAAFHHAAEAYLVPDTLKNTHGKPPAVALFASAARYKREAYRASEFAPRILAQHGITVTMKSDHPALNARHLLYEAQQAYFYGLPYNLALASVTSKAAEVMGMSHRIGYIKEGYDADIVVWDSHPLALGATPAQVFIDGIPQLKRPFVSMKPPSYQKLPKVPNFNKEAAKVVKYDGLPPLEPKRALANAMVFTNVKQVFRRSQTGEVMSAFSSVEENSPVNGVVIVEDGIVTCSGSQEVCSSRLSALTSRDAGQVQTVDLEGGTISPGFLSYGSPLGLEHITLEPSTNDGTIYDPLTNPPPQILGGEISIIQAADGIQFATRDALLAYRFGVTSAVTAPRSEGFFGGLGVHFSTGALHRMERDAVLQEVTAVHVAVKHFGNPSVSTQIATLRRLLSGKVEGAVGEYFDQVRSGQIPLVVEAHSADIIASLLILKQHVEVETRMSLKMTITGGSEAHLLAQELANARVGVILSPSRPFPFAWEDRRILPGPPLTNQTALTALLEKGVLVGIGCQAISEARNLPFDLSWAAIDAGGELTREEVFAIGSSNLEKLLGVERDHSRVELVATRGGDLLDFYSKVVAVISPETAGVYIVEESD